MDRFNAGATQSETAQTDPASRVGEEAMEAITTVLQQADDAGDDCVPPEEKLRLIRADPVVCATYFREIVLQLKKYLRARVNGPMRRYFARDWFRIEFQQRGSPHAHCLLWVNDGPDQPLDDLAKTAAFINELLTCDSDHPLASRNKHNHTATCFKNKFIRHRFVKKQLEPHEEHRHYTFICIQS
ncbi:putative L-ascorbate peroxidase 5, chloroplastic [Frankliniella fusca]|uniref:L-ascorbate peroxidase 5, chloroplastic n=1 Tax=Frankliniella fusca TaxID=407009 RepID=A0AAE1HJW3_9NEOP|nr:putative L-ascorbate peroxidase 5, chloroplastic [Frankliniella fusca]